MAGSRLRLEILYLRGRSRSPRSGKSGLGSIWTNWLPRTRRWRWQKRVAWRMRQQQRRKKSMEMEKKWRKRRTRRSWLLSQGTRRRTQRK
uniref:Uncharacterized protein n=1 Tax=Arundo donax TaxID=35708 RepID=A0A0A9CJW4_ARUDO